GVLPRGARHPPSRVERPRSGAGADAARGDRGGRRLPRRGPPGDGLLRSGGRRPWDRRVRSVSCPGRASTLTRRLRDGAETAGRGRNAALLRAGGRDYTRVALTLTVKPREGARHASTRPDRGTASASPGEGRGGPPQARGAQGRAEVRKAHAEGRAVQAGRRHR